ncbi:MULTISPECIES: ABC transporter ATP-binding protein [unclassified Isoptericola]|uniref:ABC transporter ATP-binding protein n=1 Tax=unclassified Isoptericola TaxID=2623355 RepID=UPI0027140DE8|nr:MULTISPECIES: ABC transporter ATP-binding protein [unclassified Isoptericola]MDO8143559.1 ABC transporter ATP-binding protein [Isoptericola sp. 178]MDO8147425.1 ABC transporter ATP-binding protein [Isoptericola sp. b515]MDO8150266.1 ABC transporter ATP-binding protein [Isoptericola sp. b408]
MTSTPSAGALPIEIHDLHKHFGPTRALDGLDLSVAEGEVAGFLGPNGSGKSTTIRVLLGLLRATAGSARLFGADPWRDAVELHRRLAYVPGDVTLWPHLTGGEAIDFLSRLRGRPDPRRKAELLEAFELDPSKKARTYSKGNRQKVALVAAFATEVPLLILDEPTAGLDPLMEAVFTERVREAAAQGTSVLLSSHILSEVEKVCDTVTIIRAGRAVESGTLDELRHLTRSSVTAVVAGDPARVTALDGVHDLQTHDDLEGTRISFDVDNTAMGSVLTALSGLDVRSFTAAPPSLEELFLRHYGDDVSADGESTDGTGNAPGRHAAAPTTSEAGAR